MDGSVIFCLIVLIAPAIIVAMRNSGRQKEVQEAHRQYQEALQGLKMNPHDANLKQATLSYGRAYSNLTRDKKGVTIFDEMALMNDLNAATASVFRPVSAPPSYVPPAAPVSYTPAPSTQSLDPAERLRKLDDLKAQSLITDEEYTARRAKILEDL